MPFINKGETYTIRPGDHFNILLPDGSLMNCEQTADDFQIVRGNGLVAYTKPTSEVALHIESNDAEQTTGRN